MLRVSDSVPQLCRSCQGGFGVWIVAGPQEVDLCVPSLSSLMFMLGQFLGTSCWLTWKQTVRAAGLPLRPLYLDVWLIHASNRHPGCIITGNLCAGRAPF